ncbi:Calx-beta domain-containing protein [Paenibacillus sp. SI8]|uniref:Calx-beta domain-containing protein n=1 Tax=unclassified Paenibacillus TaxID=185978 RepID=UPI0034659468
MIISVCKSMLRSMVLLGVILVLLTALTSVASAESVAVATVPGRILDYNSARILYATTDSVSIRDRTTKQDTTVPFADVKQGSLTSGGAIFVGNSNLYAWNNGSSPTLIVSNLIGYVGKSGDYVRITTTLDSSYQIWIYNTNDNSYLNVSAENQLNAKLLPNSYAAISKDGQLVYQSEQGTNVLYDHGQTTNLPFDGTPVSIDGNLIYYVKLSQDGLTEHRIYHIQEQTSSLLISANSNAALDYVNVKMNHGWVAYQDEHSVFRVSPSGAIEQSKGPHWVFFDLEAVSDIGELLVFDDYTYERFFVNQEGVLKKIESTDSPMGGPRKWVKSPSSDKWYAASGSSIYELLPEPYKNQGKFRFAPDSTLQWVDENDGTVTVNVYRVGGSSGEVSVQYTTSSDTALENSDFIPAKGKLTFANGETKKTIQIQLVDDKKKEGFKSFSLKLTGPAEYLASPETNTAFFAIRDDD